MKTLDFIGVGGLSYDLILSVERLPSSDDKIPATFVGRLPGGFIANATCAAARFGLNTSYIGWVGEDAEGKMLAREFVRYGINVEGLVHVPNEVTPFTVVIVNEDGERAIIIPGAALYDQPLTEAQLAFAQQAQIVFTYPRDEVWCHSLADAAHFGGGIFALDVETTSPLTGDALSRAIELADVVFVTQQSLLLAGVTSLEQLSQPRWVIMTAGKSGAYGFDTALQQLIHQPAFPVKTVDTTGAGDCFHAAVLAAWRWGWSLRKALAFASAAAAIKIQHQGARSGLPTRAEVETLLSRVPQRT